MKVNLSNLHEFLEYNEQSPSGLIWKKDNIGTNGRKYHLKGSVAGFVKDSGKTKQKSWVVIIDDVRCYVHRIIFKVIGNDLTKDSVVDHLDGNPLNNALSNLRITTQETNMKNSKKSSANSTGVTGVSYTCRKNKHPVYIATWYEEVGKLKKPVILKRGMSATLKEWLYATEYIMNEGNFQVVLCERGIRTFENYTRNTLDLNSVAVIKQKYRLPVIVDPSHGTGIREIVPRMCLAAIAAGADGLMVESHVRPDNAISDAVQTIKIETLVELQKKIKLLQSLNL